MKLLLRSVILVVSAIWIAPNAMFASHISGGDISYECLGNNQYKITLNLFRDCSGITMSNSESISLQSSCGTQNLTASLVNPGGTEISQLCAEQTPNSTCSGGNLPGMERYTYEVTATMTPCSDWVISWSTCCRNTTVNVPTSSSDGVYIEAGMNSALDSCNNSPVFTSQPIPYVCANTQVIYNWGITELDGDSLTYELFAARDDASTNLTYTSPYSASNPINGIVIDQFTGQITFTPTTIGNFIIAVLVNEYDSAGNLLSTTMRDIQFVVQNCSNNPPPAGQGEIDSLTGTANQTGAFALELCDGGSFSFNITIADSNSQDTITLTSNVTTVLPGSVFTTTGINPVTATISWSAPGGSTFFNYFTVFANDGACPIAGIQSYVYQVSVIPGTVAGPDTSILCGAQAIQLGAIGGTNFVWSVISGDPIVVGTNFTCDSCPNPIARPSVTTFYEVVSDLTSSTCVNKDTVQVKVVPEFTYSKSQNDSAICLNDQVQFTVTPDSTSTSYTYDWTPSSIFDNDSLSDPTATFTTSGTKPVYFEITSLEGCVKTDSMQVLVSSAQKPMITIFADTTLCEGDSTQLNALNGCPIPASCGLSTSVCPIIPSEVTVGTGTSTLSNTSYPAPYGNWYMGARHQMLFTAAELNALGFQGGQISALALNIASINGTTVYNNFEIKIGCTSITSLTTWQTGLVIVFPSQTINIASGWNTHTFVTSYDWDGMSNIIVEICYNNQPLSWTNNSPTYYTATTFPSVIWYNADANPSVCTSTSVNSFSPNNTYRPNVKFTVRGGLPSSTFDYTWAPALWLSDSTVQDPWARPLNDTTYTVIVYDTIGGCADTASINIQAVPNFIYAKSQSDTTICLQEQVQFSLMPDTSSPSYTYAWTPAAIFNDPAISDPVGTFNSPGTMVVYFEIANNGGCNKTDSMTVEVSPSKQPVVAISGDTLVCVGDSTQLMGIDSSSGVNCSYTLKMYDSWGDGWNGATLSFFSNGNLVGTYTLLSTEDSSSVSIPVTSGNSISIGFVSGSFPAEESYILYDSEGNIIFQDGPTPANGANVWSGTANCPGAGFPNHSFTWSPSTWLNNSSIANPISAPQSDTAYTLIVTDTIGGCADTASINIYVNTQFNFQKSQSNDSICLGESVQFTLTPDTGQVYTYQWIPAVYLDNAGISSPVAGPMNTPGSYTYVFTISNGCEKTDSMKITVSQGDLPVISIAGNDSICEGGNTQLTATSTGGNAPTYSFDWTNGLSLSDSAISNPLASPSATTTYTLIVTDTIGQCADTATFTVGVVPYPVAQIAPLTDSVCELDNFMVLTATPAGGSWSGTGTTVNGIFAPNLAGPGTHTVTYSVTLPPSGFGCTDQDILTINVYPNPEVPIASTSDPYCAFSTIDSMVATAGGGFITWYNDAALTDTFYYGNPVYNIEAGANSFDVWVTETSVMGCESNGAFNLTIEIISNPSASFTANPAQGFSPLTVDFTNTSQPDTNNFTWDFAGLGSSTLDDPSFVFNEPGTYEVTLTATDTNGCMDTSKVTIIVDEDSKLVIPNIFTPNGDGKNDVFKVQYTALTAFNVAIFTRWGTKVYESTDPSQGWDGKDKQGQEVHPGVYFYVITAKDRKGSPITDDTIKGTVTLVRD